MARPASIPQHKHTRRLGLNAVTGFGRIDDLLRVDAATHVRERPSDTLHLREDMRPIVFNGLHHPIGKPVNTQHGTVWSCPIGVVAGPLFRLRGPRR